MLPSVRVLLAAVVALLACVAAAAGRANSGRIWFPLNGARRTSAAADATATTATASATTTITNNTAQPAPIPLQLLRQLGSAHNLTQFLSFLDPDTQSEEMGPDLGNRIFSDFERKHASHLNAIGYCMPQPELVTIMTTSDPSLYYFPVCTRINRCGGCCGSKLDSCQPTATEIVNIQVQVVGYTDDGRLRNKGIQIVPLEQHTDCKCDCIKKASDCNQLQIYDKDKCACHCNNFDEANKCLEQKDIKEWDESICNCKCKETRECSSNRFFDDDLCRCSTMSKLKNSSRREFYLWKST